MAEVIKYMLVAVARLFGLRLNFDALEDALNKAYGTSYRKGQTTLQVNPNSGSPYDPAQPGYIYTGSNYRGRIGYAPDDPDTLLVIMDAGKLQWKPVVHPLSEFIITNKKKEDRPMKCIFMIKKVTSKEGDHPQITHVRCNNNAPEGGLWCSRHDGSPYYSLSAIQAEYENHFVSATIDGVKITDPIIMLQYMGYKPRITTDNKNTKKENNAMFINIGEVLTMLKISKDNRAYIVVDGKTKYLPKDAYCWHTEGSTKGEMVVDSTDPAPNVEITNPKVEEKPDIRVECDACHGSGRYIMTHPTSGQKLNYKCFRCSGKGYQLNADRERNADYDRRNPVMCTVLFSSRPLVNGKVILLGKLPIKMERLEQPVSTLVRDLVEANKIPNGTKFIWVVRNHEPKVLLTGQNNAWQQYTGRPLPMRVNW